MNAYDSACYDDFLCRTANGETLTAQEQARFTRLERVARLEWESQPHPQWLGGDYPDVF